MQNTNESTAFRDGLLAGFVIAVAAELVVFLALMFFSVWK